MSASVKPVKVDVPVNRLLTRSWPSQVAWRRTKPPVTSTPSRTCHSTRPPTRHIVFWTRDEELSARPVKNRDSGNDTSEPLRLSWSVPSALAFART